MGFDEIYQGWDSDTNTTYSYPIHPSGTALLPHQNTQNWYQDGASLVIENPCIVAVKISLQELFQSHVFATGIPAYKTCDTMRSCEDLVNFVRAFSSYYQYPIYPCFCLFSRLKAYVLKFLCITCTAGWANNMSALQMLFLYRYSTFHQTT